MRDLFRTYRQNLLIYAIIFLTFLIFMPSLRHEFVNLDDPNHITENPQIHSLSVSNIGQIFTSTIQRTYIPLTIFSFAIEYSFVKNGPWLYHLDNIFLHLLVVFLIYRLGLALGLRPFGASIAAFIFALHPMHVESVAWATERKDVLYSVFYLGAVITYLKFLKNREWRYFGFSLFLAFLSILSKPMAVTLPLILLLCDWFIDRKIKTEDWINKIPFGILLIPIAWITYSINTGTVGQDPGPGLLYRFWAAAFYLKKFFWPVLFIPHYLPPLPADISHIEYWTSVLVLAVSVLTFWVIKDRWLRFAFLWYVLSIFILLNFDHERVMQVVADRYMYLPSVGFCFLAGHWIERIENSKNNFAAARYATLFVVILVSIFLPLKTYTQISIWKNSLTLWNYTIAHNPASFLAFNNRGRVYEKTKQYKFAENDYKEGIRLNPKYEKPYKNLAMVYEGMGRWEDAFIYYSKAIEVKPNYFEAYNNRGLLYQKKGDLKNALNDFDHAIAANPEYILGYTNRTVCYDRLHKFNEALEDCQKAALLAPRDQSITALCSTIRKNLQGY